MTATSRRSAEKTQASGSQKQFFDENGYLILEGFFEASQIARLKTRIDELWADRGPDCCPLVIDCLYNGAGERASRHRRGRAASTCRNALVDCAASL
jgi:hypothetical protein